MLLILTNSTDATSDYLERRLAASSINFARVNTDCCSTTFRVHIRAGRAALKTERRSIFSDEVANVWFRRPGPIDCPVSQDPAETKHVRDEWSEALEGFFAQIAVEAWVNHPARNVMASHKIEQLARASRMGLATPETIVTQSPEEARQFFYECREEVIVKPLASGYIERNDGSDTVLYTHAILASDLSKISSIAKCPTLLQRKIRKQRDIRVTVMDDDIHAVSLSAKEIGEQQRLDIRRDNMRDVQYKLTEIPNDVRQNIFRYHKSYGLRFSAIDMAIDRDGKWIFFEINPNGQWAWTDLAGVTDIGASFIKAFQK
jgi:glutathione synthase/RimK-type ligase-like ATP-grasp enzyme